MNVIEFNNTVVQFLRIVPQKYNNYSYDLELPLHDMVITVLSVCVINVECDILCSFPNILPAILRYNWNYCHATLTCFTDFKGCKNDIIFDIIAYQLHKDEKL